MAWGEGRVEKRRKGKAWACPLGESTSVYLVLPHPSIKKYLGKLELELGLRV